MDNILEYIYILLPYASINAGFVVTIIIFVISKKLTEINGFPTAVILFFQNVLIIFGIIIIAEDSMLIMLLIIHFLIIIFLLILFFELYILTIKYINKNIVDIIVILKLRKNDSI